MKHWHYTKALAMVFVAYIMGVGVVALRPAALIVRDYLREDGSAIFSTRLLEKIDEAYRNMLEFEGPPPVNKGAYINFNGLMARLMGQRYVNERVKLDNGHLASLIEPQDAASAVQSLTMLYNRQKERGKDFLFVLAPYQIPQYEDVLPAGYTDYANQNADIFMAQLTAQGVPVLDLREALHNEGISHADAFFVTDHHWKPETGFWAYAKIVDYLTQSDIIKPVDSMYTDINAFEKELYTDWFLGSSGKRTGRYYAGMDDFTVLTPAFDTDISLEIASGGIDLRGAFAEIAYDYSKIRRDYFTSTPYVAYGHGDWGHAQWRSEAAPADIKILGIGDSFANVPFTFMPLAFRSCDTVDLRYYEWDFMEYYNAYDPDVVVVLIGASGLVQANTVYEFLQP